MILARKKNVAMNLKKYLVLAKWKSSVLRSHSVLSGQNSGQPEESGHEDEEIPAFGQMEIALWFHKNVAKFLIKHLV